MNALLAVVAVGSVGVLTYMVLAPVPKHGKRKKLNGWCAIGYNYPKGDPDRREKMSAIYQTKERAERAARSDADFKPFYTEVKRCSR
jgi:hypothetical protein